MDGDCAKRPATYALSQIKKKNFELHHPELTFLGLHNIKIYQIFDLRGFANIVKNIIFLSLSSGLAAPLGVSIFVVRPSQICALTFHDQDLELR
jgi:hypothetical protein